VAGDGGVPVGEQAAILSVTATDPTLFTFITAYPGGVARSGAVVVTGSI